MSLLQYREKQAVIHFPRTLFRFFLAALMLCQASFSALAVQNEFWQDVTEEATLFEDGLEPGGPVDNPSLRSSTGADVTPRIQAAGLDYTSRNASLGEGLFCSSPHSTGPPVLYT